jgi:hypothetical protein
LDNLDYEITQIKNYLQKITFHANSSNLTQQIADLNKVMLSLLQISLRIKEQIITEQSDITGFQ